MAETKKTSTTKKPTTKKPVAKKPVTKKPVAKKTTSKTVAKKAPIKKTTTKKKPVVTEVVKKDAVVKVTPKKKAPVKKKRTSTPKTKKQLNKEIVTKAAIKKVFEGEKKPEDKKKRGKTFYLVFSVLFFAAAFFYINNVLYDNSEYLESALFAFAALFVVFILLQFNIHLIFVNFFVLPFKFLLTEAQLEIKKDVIVDPDKKGMGAKFSKYKAIFTLFLYTVIMLLLIGSQVYNGIMDNDLVLVIITQSLSTGLVFLIIVCSWQYLFNIIPNILDKSIDAKNGFILTLSAFVMIVYVVFIIFEISYLAEMMIFILIIGFIALLGVNLNMIVGEINIFSNLRDRKSKTVTRVVFMIFFSFHLYIILYSSVVAYSIYNWNNDTYNFANFEYKEVIVEEVNHFGTPLTDVYDSLGVAITTVYDSEGNEITDFINDDGDYLREFYDINGDLIIEYYPDPTGFNSISEVEKDGLFYYPGGSNTGDYEFTFYEGTLVGIQLEELPHTYGDMLYYAVITISSVGYGDISPNSNYALPQFWGGFLSIYGITFYALSIGFVSNIAIAGTKEDREEDREED